MRAFRPGSFWILPLFALVLGTPGFSENLGLPSQQPPAAPRPLSDAAADAKGEIPVCLAVDAIVNFQSLMGGERTAALLFDGIGVHLRWSCGHSRDTSRRPIAIHLVDRTDPAFLKGALGFARPFARDGVLVTIFYDRVDDLQRGRDSMGLILGHTIAHELTHVLEGEDRHSEDGIMRSRWDDHDFQSMRMRTLYFTRDDVSAIYRNLATFIQP